VSRPCDVAAESGSSSLRDRRRLPAMRRGHRRMPGNRKYLQR